MKTLSVRAPYIFDIMKGAKTVEYRTWQTPHRGDLLLVSSSSPWASYYDEKDKDWYDYNFKGSFPLGYAMCVINLTECRKVEDQYNWLFDNVRFVKPFPVKGKLHLFEVEEKPQYIKRLDALIKLWAKEGLIQDDRILIDNLITTQSVAEFIYG